MASPSAQSELGGKAIDFDLQGADGRRYRLSDVSAPNGTLVMFICNHCPYVKAVEDRCHISDFHATILHLMGLDHTKLTYFYQGFNQRLTGVRGELVEKMLA